MAVSMKISIAEFQRLQTEYNVNGGTEVMVKQVQGRVFRFKCPYCGASRKMHITGFPIEFWCKCHNYIRVVGESK